jgi:hypothetical protein
MRDALSTTISTSRPRYTPVATSSSEAEVGGKSGTGVRSRIPGGSPPHGPSLLSLTVPRGPAVDVDRELGSEALGRRMDMGSAGSAGSSLDGSAGSGGAGTGTGRRRDARAHGPQCAYANACPGPDMIRDPGLYLSYTLDTALL